MQALTLAERRAKENGEFAALLTELLASMEHHGEFDLGRLYDMPYRDFKLLIGLLESWRLQRFRDDVLAEFRKPSLGERQKLGEPEQIKH